MTDRSVTNEPIYEVLKSIQAQVALGHGKSAQLSKQILPSIGRPAPTRRENGVSNSELSVRTDNAMLVHDPCLEKRTGLACLCAQKKQLLRYSGSSF